MKTDGHPPARRVRLGADKNAKIESGIATCQDRSDLRVCIDGRANCRRLYFLKTISLPLPLENTGQIGGRIRAASLASDSVRLIQEDLWSNE